MSEQLPLPRAKPGLPELQGYGSGRPRRALPLGNMALSPSPLPLAARDRAQWRVAALLLCIAACRGQSATVEQLHVLSWALRDDRNMAQLLDRWSEPEGPTALRAWDPLLDDTLRLARAQALVTQASSGRVALSEEGETLVRAIRESEGGILLEEQRSMARLGMISESGMWARLGRVVGAGKEKRGNSR